MRRSGGKAVMTSFLAGMEGVRAMMTSDDRGEGGGINGRFTDDVICEQSLKKIAEVF